MNAGELRHQIVIQAPTETQDSLGAVVSTWATFAIVRASVEPLQGREYLALQQVQSEVSVRIKIRYLPGLNARMRVSWNSKIYEIENIIEINSKRSEIHLMCRENQDG